MGITIIGYITILACLICFVRPRYLLCLFAFLSPFTAASVVIFPGSTFGLQPSYLAGGAFIARMLLKILMEKLYINKTQRFFLFLIALFWLFSLISLAWPLALKLFNIQPFLTNPQLSILTRAGSIQGYVINYMIYFTFFLLLSIFTMLEVNDFKKLLMTLRFLCMSAFFSALWAILVQYFSILFGYQYPYWLFNNHPGYSQAWSHRLWSLKVFIPRLNSIAPEPSMYAFFLLIVIALLFALNINRVYIFSKKFQQALLIILFITSFITTSTTAYVGYLVLFFMFFVFYFDFTRVLSLKVNTKLFFLAKIFFVFVVVGGGILVLLLSLFGLGVPDLANIIRMATIDKFNVGSGNLRFSLLLHGLGVFFDTYLLGTGWGSNRTVDLFSTLLANVGIIGFVLFSFMLGVVLKRAFDIYLEFRTLREDFAVISLALIFSFLMAIFLMFLAIPDFIFTYFWLIFGLLMALPMIKDNLLFREGIREK